MTPNPSPIVAKVCKHAASSRHRYDKSKDLLCAKITNVHADNSRSTSFIAMENYKQPFWIVKEDRRKFKQPKDYIEERYVREYNSPRCKIPFEVKKQLYGAADYKANIRDAKESVFVFGLDQTPAVHFKQKFFAKYGDHQEKEQYTVAAFDVEADMFVKGDKKPIMMASVTMKTKAYFAAVRSWYKEKDDETILRKLKEAEEKYLRGHLNRRKCVVEYELFDTPGEVAFACIQKFHEWEPDWVLSWNAGYDMEACERALLEAGYNLPDVYCDPSIPPEYRTYELNLGRTHKVKENGDKTPLEPQEKFPSVRTMAKWQWADAMSGYAIKRFPFGKLESYTLESISQREKVPGKLYTEEGEDHGPGSPQWHRYMQKEHPYLYSMYNIGDNFPIEEIDEQTLDYSLSIPMLLRYSEYFNFVSQPSLISDTLSFIARERGFVWGSTPPRRSKEFTDKLPTLGDWIALLDTEKNASVGRALFIGLLDVISSGRSDTSDIDVEGAYPTGTLALNVGNKTTQAEVYAIQGASPMKFREIAVNYASSTQANAIGLCHDLFRFPEISDMMAVFEKSMIEQGKEDLLKEIKKNQKVPMAPLAIHAAPRHEQTAEIIQFPVKVSAVDVEVEPVKEAA